MKTQRRRRAESRTDYKARFALLKSGKARLVIRKTNRHIIAQIVETEVAQDKVVVSVISKDLLSSGWPKERSGSLKSLAAAYLTGYMLAKKSKGIVKEAVLDLGMHRNVSGSRLFAVVKGCIDAGLDIKVDENVLPKIERISENKNIPKNIIEKIKEKI